MPHLMLRNALTTVVLLAVAASAHGATLYVANDGLDGPSCGSQTSPCRSIGQGVANAAAGDSVIVGPGRYGDLNRNGILGESGEENPDVFSPGCGCVFALNKAVSLTSSNGAAATVIDGTSVARIQNVLIITTGAQFGKSGKGFAVTSTAGVNNTDYGVAVDGSAIKIEGNQVINHTLFAPVVAPLGTGIFTVVNDTEIILIQGNQVIGWDSGIVADSAGKTVAKNDVSFSTNVGILAGGNATVVGNVISTSRSEGISVFDVGARVVGNTVSGSGGSGIFLKVLQANGVTLMRNNILGTSSNCGLFVFGSPPGVLLATNNYWGAATGPGAGPADNVCGGGTVTVTPFATKPFTVKAPIKV